MARGRLWTPAEDAALEVAWNSSDGVDQIGEALSRTPRSVKARVSVLGLKPRKRARKSAAETTAGWTAVNVLLPDHLLPAKGKRGAVIREGLELLRLLRDLGIEGTAAEIIGQVAR